MTSKKNQVKKKQRVEHKHIYKRTNQLTNILMVEKEKINYISFNSLVCVY